MKVLSYFRVFFFKFWQKRVSEGRHHRAWPACPRVNQAPQIRSTQCCLNTFQIISSLNLSHRERDA